jgi:membrane-bound lytic murein transglycosylase MltF
MSPSLTMFTTPFLLSLLLLLGACDGDGSAEAAAQVANAEVAEAPPTDTGEAEQSRSLEELQAALGIPGLAMPWAGDLDGMEERRLIRVLTVYGMPRYFLDGAREQGLVFELFKLFEKFVNQRLERDQLPVYVAFIPVARGELLQGLIDGRGDIAAAGLTITRARDEEIDFTDPLTREISEVLVTGPSAPEISAIEELSGREVYVRASSSYRTSLDHLNRRLAEAGRPEVILRDASEYLEDEDLMEMVDSGMLPWVVVDDYKALAWAEAFDNLTVREDLVLREGGRLGYAVRENSPRLLAALNEFLSTHKQGTLTGNVLINRYVRDFDWSENALAIDDYEKFERVAEIFERYGRQYGLDYLLVAAQGYQESRLDQSLKSKAGAIGIMQMLPSTARDPNVDIPDITTAENNIHAGIRYLNYLRDQYFDDLASDPFNQTLFALAAYNAGPARVRSLRGKAAGQGYDPDRWFDNVEVIAAREVGREPVTYVANILKYYVAYSLSVAQQQQRETQREKFEPEG